MRRRTLPGLGSLQAEVMELVWQRGEATVGQVVEHLSRRREMTYTTVLVAMQKLEKKGWLAHRSEGRAYVYYAARSRQTAQAGLLRELLDAAFGGDPKMLVSQLLDARAWNEEQLAQMRKLIDIRRRKGGTP